MRTGNKFTMEAVNNETTSALFEQLAGILGVSKRSDGKYHLADIATAPSITIWAKFKSFGYNSENFDYDPHNPDGGNKRRNDARKSVNQAIDFTNALISTTSDVSGIAAKYAQGDINNGWRHLPPQGRANNQPYRLRDFDGYDHGALPFVYGFTVPSAWAKDQGEFDVSFRIPIESDDILTYKDFPILQNCYLGVAMIAGNTVYRMTNSNTIAEAGLSLKVPTTFINPATYTLYPFVSSVQLGILDGGFVPAQIYTIPQSSGKTLVLASGTVTITIKGVYSNTTDSNGFYSMSYTITIQNNGAGSLTLSNNAIYVLYGNKTSIGVLDKDEKMMELNLGRDILVAAGKSTSVEGVIGSIIPALRNNSKIWVSLQSSKYVQSAPPQSNIQGQ